MVQKDKKRLILTAVLAALVINPLSAQQKTEQTDSLVRLMTGKSVQLIEKNGIQMRKAVAPTFLHNGTYLICDSSLWYIDDKIINCEGNVQLIQGETVLTSDRLDYLIDEDLAQFRGGTVQLRNKKENILRTRNLDYNTRDSLATFFNGASMKSEDGQIIESDSGTYSNASGFFDFRGDVNMYTDSVFVRTTSLEYDSNRNKAYFTAYIDFWKDGKMLSAGGGWYDRDSETFFFKDDVHGLSEEQETWSDTLYYYRNRNDVLMLGRAHVQDTSRRVAALADYILYEDSLARVTMKQDAAVAMWQETSEGMDTTYIGADRWIYESIRMCDVPSSEIDASKSRLEEMDADAVAEYRKRADSETAAENAKKAENNPNIPAGGPKAAGSKAQPSGKGAPTSKAEKKQEAAPKETAEAAKDTTVSAGSDSLKFASADTLSVAPDTTKVGFALGLGNVRVFKNDMQVRCDSLRYCDLDSIARLYKDPVVWNEIRRQYTSDSLFVLVRNQSMDRASLMSNAFIITQEDSLSYDQIKSTDAMAYFGAQQELSRFDALGGATALFYLEEDGTLATVNKVESRILSASLKDGEVQRIYYYDSPKNDAYPVVQLPSNEKILKGFNWRPDERPTSKEDVTDISVKESEREYYESRPKSTFHQTDLYFPGFMDDVYKGLEDAKTRPSRPEPDRPAADTLLPPPSVAGNVGADSGDRDIFVEPVQVSAAPDSLQSVTDSLMTAPLDSAAVSTGPVKEDKKMSEGEIRRAERTAAREARWAELDARDAAKAAAKAEKKAARAARKAEKEAARKARQEARDQAKLQKYVERYQKQKARHEGTKQEPDPSGERPQGTEAGGDIQTAPES